MAKLFLRRTLGGWINADETSQESAKRFKLGEVYRATVVKPRSLKTLGRYWALVDLIMDNADLFKSKEQVHDYLKIRAGHCTQIVSKSTGEIYLLADSIDFDTLDESAFEEIWQRVCDVTVEDILPGITQRDIEHEVAKIVGIAA